MPIVLTLRTLLLLAISSVACLSNEARAAEPLPNVVIVLFDDLGWGQPPCYREDSALRTPNVDRLATEGMRFTDAHSASAVCTPTRYGLLTGRYPWRIGQFGVLQTFDKPIIPTTRLTLASLLKQHGYHTACVGKWHLGLDWHAANPQKSKVPAIGETIDQGPNELGFDYFSGFTHARNIGMIIEQHQVIAQVEPVENQPLLLKKAVTWLEQQQAETPFFLYFPLCPPHTPVVPAEEYVGVSGAKDLVRNDPQYGDWLYQGDAMLGAIVETLERKGLADNTLLIVASDNGAAGRPYAPLRAAKTSIYEGGHRVPMVVRWPGKVAANSRWGHTVCLNDWLATTAEIVQHDLPDNAGEDSVSMLPALLGTTATPTRTGTVHQSHRGDLAIRSSDWKLIAHKNGKRELFDLTADLGEQKSVLADYPDVASRLQTQLEQYVEQGRSTPGAPQANRANLKLQALQPAKKQTN
ncbi:sulfatase family protein [Aeoliella mucimassa]|nr:arylsulfatase [Aeoliella mucimassa]